MKIFPSSKIFPNVLRLRTSLILSLSFLRAPAFSKGRKERRMERYDGDDPYDGGSRRTRNRQFHRARRTAREIRDTWREARKEKGN